MKTPKIKDMQQIGAFYMYAENDYYVIRVSLTMDGKEYGMEERIATPSLAVSSAAFLLRLLADPKAVKKALK